MATPVEDEEYERGRRRRLNHASAEHGDQGVDDGRQAGDRGATPSQRARRHANGAAATQAIPTASSGTGP
jgi:hypothetical protein